MPVNTCQPALLIFFPWNVKLLYINIKFYPYKIFMQAYFLDLTLSPRNKFTTTTNNSQQNHADWGQHNYTCFSSNPIHSKPPS
jgi:hypothetical protein